MNLKTFEIKKENFIDWDEFWAPWFKCPNCECGNITTDFNYCPGCGVEITFGEEVKKMVNR